MQRELDFADPFFLGGEAKDAHSFHKTETDSSLKRWNKEVLDDMVLQDIGLGS